LITAKNRISVPSRPASIAEDTGSGTSTAAMRTTSHASITIVSRPSIQPQNPCHALNDASMPSSSAMLPTSKSCHGRKRSMKSSTPAPSMICAPRERADNLSIPPVLSVGIARLLHRGL
jgi:hypothetical protein